MTAGSASVGPIVFGLAYPQALVLVQRHAQYPGGLLFEPALRSVIGRSTLPFVPGTSLNGSTSPLLEKAAGIFSVLGLPYDH